MHITAWRHTTKGRTRHASMMQSDGQHLCAATHASSACASCFLSASSLSTSALEAAASSALPLSADAACSNTGRGTAAGLNTPHKPSDDAQHDAGELVSRLLAVAPVVPQQDCADIAANHLHREATSACSTQNRRLLISEAQHDRHHTHQLSGYPNTTDEEQHATFWTRRRRLADSAVTYSLCLLDLASLLGDLLLQLLQGFRGHRHCWLLLPVLPLLVQESRHLQQHDNNSTYTHA